jgi:hypothetical protein
MSMIIAGLSRMKSPPAGRQSTLAALAAATGVAVTGAVVWGLVALLIHRQLSLLGLLIGAGVGFMVARYRPGHMPAIVAGAVIAVAGCALGTLLGMVFIALNEQISLSVILHNLGPLFRAYPGNVGVLGVLFYALAAFAAIRVPLQGNRRPARMAQAPAQYGAAPEAFGTPPAAFGTPPAAFGPAPAAFGPAPAAFGPAPAAMTGPSPAPAQPPAGVQPGTEVPPAAEPGR